MTKEAVCKVKYVRVSPKKVNRILKEIRSKSVADAERILEFLPQRAAEHIRKTLKSAVANAVNNQQLKKESLIISEAIVGQGFQIKRFRAAARGRGVKITRPTSHITIKVKEKE
jgi:large subunit ribosomal protein L22